MLHILSFVLSTNRQLYEVCTLTHALSHGYYLYCMSCFVLLLCTDVFDIEFVVNFDIVLSDV